jgi:hypothetical protein
MQEEIAPPFESWPEHLRGLENQDLAELAKDYSWLNGQVRPQEARAEFDARRQAIISELERRGMHDVANQCRQPS